MRSNPPKTTQITVLVDSSEVSLENRHFRHPENHQPEKLTGAPAEQQ